MSEQQWNVYEADGPKWDGQYRCPLGFDCPKFDQMKCVNPNFKQYWDLLYNYQNIEEYERCLREFASAQNHLKTLQICYPTWLKGIEEQIRQQKTLDGGH
jgi:hypothetical protein